MTRFIEKSVFLRTLNYIRVRHGYFWQFNFIIPALLTVFIYGLIFIFAKDPNIYGETGLLSKFSQLLAILAPFFIAALAAVATFSGSDIFNEKFKMEEAVKLEVLDQGSWIEKHLTLRQFLSLLFGYCTVNAIVLFLATLIGPVIAPGVAALLGSWSVTCGTLFFVIFMFAFCHMITATFLGLYYLSDKMHRG